MTVAIPDGSVGKNWAIRRLTGGEVAEYPREVALLETDGAAYLSPQAARWLATLLLAYAETETR